MKIVLVTGGFDPLHSGHLAYFKAARQLGDKLIVGLNSDEWLTRKKGQPFMPLDERRAIVNSINDVDATIIFNDDDNSSKDAIYQVKQLAGYGNTVIFANGGDRTDKNIPEMTPELLDDIFVEFVFGVGGEDKKNSSSWILKEWQNPTTIRTWGNYRVLHDLPGCKVKELVIEPGKSMSMQRHFHRAEHWYVLKGQCQVEIVKGDERIIDPIEQNHSYVIGQSVWHRGFNNSGEPCHILEVQHGEMCVEEDIERM
jgi:cytidyltransferase-like protein